MKFTFPPESKPFPGFTIKRAVHRGGFGEVYYALTDAGKEVALKLLSQHTDVELRGATACLNLNHPHLVTIYDIKTDTDGDHWVVMEYVGGKRLCDVLEEKGTLPAEEIERWLDGIAAGLAFLHERGIVHRDLKPSNVFSENGVVKVGDVGLSKFISESRKSAHTQSVGTVYYMAPEVARGRYGREVDVYALGIILYEMLTGEVPFDGESTGEILMKHLSQPPNLEKIPARLRPVLARALEKDPQRRTATVQRLRDEFKAAMRGRLTNDEAEEIPASAFLDGRAGFDPHDRQRLAGVHAATAQADAAEYARRAQKRSEEDAGRYSLEARRAAAQGYAQGARRASGKNPCEPGHGCGRRVSHAYADANRHWPGQTSGETNWTPVIVIASIAVYLLFTRTGQGLVPSLWEGAIMAAIAYGLYSVVKWMTPTPAPVSIPFNHGTPTAGSDARRNPPPATLHNYARNFAADCVLPNKNPSLTPDTPRVISNRQRASQFSGSMIVAALAAAIITGVLTAFGFVKDLPSALLFGGTAVLGSWMMLAATKAIEGTGLSRSMRRLWQGAAGILVGGMAWGLDQFLLVDLAHGGRHYGLVTSIGDMSFVEQGEPAAVAYMAFFGLLFGLRRWWWQADAYRPKRLKVTSALFTALLGYVLTTIIYFPHAWGTVWAVVIACVVQLAAAWTPPGDRLPVAMPQRPAA